MDNVERIEQRKQELRDRAAFYERSLKEEYALVSRDSSALGRIGMIGGGVILATFLAIKFLKPENKKENQENIPEPVSGQVTTPDLRSEFSQKAVLITMEILRLSLIFIAGKLKPSNA